MPISISKKELLEVLNAKSPSNREKITFQGVEHDSRNIKGGELFVALKGESTHGHKFVKDVLDKGAALALVETDNIEGVNPEQLVIVTDSLLAYGKLASWWRDKINLPVIGVTGSVGKTTVKEMLSRILMEVGIGAYSQKSYNNHVGVPYTLCKISPDHKWAVIEMGMNHKGEIDYLSNIVKPDVAVISKLAPAHIENLGSLENIAKAKLEIVSGLKENGVLIINGNDPILITEEKKLESKKYSKKLFGHSDSLSWTSNVKSLALDGISFTLHLGKETKDLKMSIIGVHNAMNAACAALAARTLFPDLEFKTIVRGLEKFTAPIMRLEIYDLPDGRRIVDDSYNANPESMSALIGLASEVKSQGVNIGLVVGDMRELGDHAREAHIKLGEEILKLKPAFCIAVGPNSMEIFSVLNGKIEVKHAEDAKEAITHLSKYSYDVLMVKASRGIGLDQVVQSVVSSAAIAFKG